MPTDFTDKKTKSFLPKTRHISNDTIKNLVKSGEVNGKWCTEVEEDFPELDDAPCEVVYKGKNNSEIVLGRDRNEGWASGAGGKGMTSSGMIDLVAGRASSWNGYLRIKNKPVIGTDQQVNPMFHCDAARVYITQKCLNIDEYFGFSNEMTGRGKGHGRTPKNKSAVGIKADHVRVIARETVRIIAGRGHLWEGFDSHGERSSTGSEIPAASGRIHLIAGNGQEKDLQPMVLGNNLVKYLKRMDKRINNLREDISTLSGHMGLINGSVGTLTQNPKLGKNACENAETMVQKVIGSVNQVLEQAGSLETTPIEGVDSILSTSVMTT